MSSKSNNDLLALAIIVGIVSMIVGVIIAVNSESIGYFFAAVCFGLGVLALGAATGIVSKLNTLHSAGAIICIILAILVFGFKSCSDGIDKTLDKTPRRRHYHYYNGSHSENTSSHGYTIQYLVMKEGA